MAECDAVIAIFLALKTLEQGYHMMQRKHVRCKLVGVVMH